MNQVYASQRYIRRGLGCNSCTGFGDDMTDNAGSGGGYYDAPPADSGSDYGGGYGLDYYDSANGIYYDSYGNAWDAIGSGIFSNQDFTPDAVDANGFPILNINTSGNDPLKDIDLSALGQTLDWWQAINADPSLPVTLPPVPVSIPLILQIPDSGIVPPGLVLPPALNALPPKQLAAIKKALQNQVQKAAQAASSGGSSAGPGSKPQSVQPSANKTCPPGYTLNAAKTACMLNQQLSTSGSFMTLLQNPLVWVLVLGAVVLAKR